MKKTSGFQNISTRLLQIAELARRAPQMAFTTLAHHMDIELMREAYRRTRKDGAMGVDGQTAADFALELDCNLLALLNKAKSGTYRAPPVRRVHIPKGDGDKTRPIGIPTFEDKVLQRAVTMILEAVYEQDFKDFSFGFRPGKSAHQALDALREGLMEFHGGYVIEVDIEKFFDTLDHAHLRAFLSHRVGDGVLMRLIGKWLNAGVLEAGNLAHPEAGTPQGGVISPLLANIYLHEVFDQWFHDVVRPRLRGQAVVVRYADDLALAFSDPQDAQRVMEALPKRFGRYGLRLHPEKTRMLPFQRPSLFSSKETAGGPGTFDMLGFTHMWARTRKGGWAVKRRTAKGRFKRAVRKVWEWCRDNRHRPLEEQRAHLTQMLRGHWGYYGITGNSQALQRYREAAIMAWQRWLSRRSQRGYIAWEHMRRLMQRYPLPPVRTPHSSYVT